MSYKILHYIDLENEVIEPKNVEQGDLDDYISKLTNRIITRGDSRLFGVRSITTEVISSILNFIESGTEEDFLYTASIIANRLLQVEITTQQRLRGFSEIQKGSLIQSYINGRDVLNYLIAKVEHDAFIDTNDLNRKLGLPYEKHVLKYCLISISENGEILDIAIDDSNSKISNFWWENFLELRYLNSNEKNTNKAYNAMEHLLSKKVKDNSPSDYTVLRNTLVRYFKAPGEFIFEDMLNTVFGEYQPDNPENVNIEQIKEHARRLPETKGFDRRFEIIPSVIRAKIKRVISLSDKIELNIKGHIDGIKHAIQSIEEQNGDKFVRIKTDNDEAFRMFKFT